MQPQHGRCDATRGGPFLKLDGLTRTVFDELSNHLELVDQPLALDGGGFRGDLALGVAALAARAAGALAASGDDGLASRAGMEDTYGTGETDLVGSHHGATATTDPTGRLYRLWLRSTSAVLFVQADAATTDDLGERWIEKRRPVVTVERWSMAIW